MFVALTMPAARAEGLPASVSVSAPEPVSLDGFGRLFKEAAEVDVTFHLSPTREYLRSDTGRRVKFNWSGAPGPLLDAITRRFNLSWRADWNAVRIYDDARLLPAVISRPVEAKPVEVVAVPASTAAPADLPGSGLSSSAVRRTALTTQLRSGSISDPNAQASAAWSTGQYQTAVELWRRPAAQGDTTALYNLGQAARLGLGMPRDTGLAIDLYRRASAGGVVRAKTQLGLLLVQDRPTVAEGRAILAEASAAGDELARSALYALPDLAPRQEARRSIMLGDYETQKRAFRAYARASKGEALSAFTLRISPHKSSYRLTIDNVPADVAAEMCGRLALRQQYCAVN